MGGTVGMTNTPGIYYLIAYILSGWLYISVNPRRLTGWKLVGEQAVYILALSSFMLWTDGVNVKFYLPSVLFEMFLVWLSLFLCCRMDWKRTTYFCIRTMMLGEFAASLEWQLFYYFLSRGKLEWTIGWNLLFLAVIHGAVFSLMYLLERRFREGNAVMRITGKELGVAGTMAVVVYVVSNMSYAISVSPFSSQFPAEIFIIRTLADFGGVCILFAYHIQQQMLTTQLEKDFLQHLLQMQYDNYRVSAESVELVNRKYHDLKHQIQVLRHTADDAEKNAYLDYMEEEIKAYEAQNKTGNQVLDIILATKSLQCQKLGISLTCVAEGSELSFMHPMDVSALFGNALDNAIEGVSKIAQPERRLIHVSVARQKNFLRIRIENCFEGDIKFENGMPVTSKTDHRFHGFGTKSICRIAERYGGSMTIDVRENWFELRVLIPL
ncbi:MAG: GHKL domain-containing protein [Firmicutes bacterium]|nr:GHKL domain-containing protein [Bacillota bacterium]